MSLLAVRSLWKDSKGQHFKKSRLYNRVDRRKWFLKKRHMVFTKKHHKVTLTQCKEKDSELWWKWEWKSSAVIQGNTENVEEMRHIRSPTVYNTIAVTTVKGAYHVVAFIVKGKDICKLDWIQSKRIESTQITIDCYCNMGYHHNYSFNLFFFCNTIEVICMQR